MVHTLPSYVTGNNFVWLCMCLCHNPSLVFQGQSLLLGFHPLFHIACHLLPDCWTDLLVKVCLRMHCILPLLFSLCLLYLRISLLCRNSGEKVGEIVWGSENVNLPDCLGLVLTAWKPCFLGFIYCKPVNFDLRNLHLSLSKSTGFDRFS